MTGTHALALPPGSTLGEYRIERLLGHGGFGITYLARDTQLHAMYAIKEFLPQEFATRTGNTVTARSSRDQESFEWGLERFKDEARALARFRHPHIARVTRLIEAHGTAYMVMEYEPGITLGEFLNRRHGTLSEAEALGIAFPLLEGMEALHAAGLIHRDIKPGNIFLRAKGGPTLIDFGAVRHVVGHGMRPLTATFTPGFAPIEQYTAEEQQSPATDIYSFGATLYRAVTGRTPTDAVRRSAALSAGRDDPQVRAIEFASGEHSIDLLECLDWTLEFHAVDRPQSAKELRDRLMSIATEPADMAAMLFATGAIDGVTEHAVGAPPPALSGGRSTHASHTNGGGPYTRFATSWRELRRRKVFRVGIAYALLGFGAVQLLSALATPLELGSTTMRWMVLGMLGGFPLALLLAWALDITPNGVRFTRDRRGGSLRRIEFAIIGTMTFAVIGIGYGLYRPSKLTPVLDSRTIAVLPFVDLSEKAGYSQFGDGLTGEIVNLLANVSDIRVVARTSSFAYKGRNTDVRTIGEELGVGAVVEGSVRRSGDRLRVTAQLIDTKSGFHLWSEDFDRTAKDLLVIQDDIARAIATSLRSKFVPEEATAGATRGTESVSANELYMLGHTRLRERTDEGIRDAVKYLKRAVEIDPKFARGHAALAEAYALLTDYSAIPEAISLPMAEEAALKALALDPRLPEARASLGLLRLDQDRAMESVRELEEAVTLDPDSAFAWLWLGHAYGNLARTADSHAAYMRALALDPMSKPIVSTAIGMYSRQLRFADVASLSDRMTRLVEPEDRSDSLVNAANAYGEARAFGMYASRMREAIAADPWNDNAYGRMTELYTSLGEYDAARRWMDASAAINPDIDSVIISRVALLLAQGDPAAFDLHESNIAGIAERSNPAQAWAVPAQRMFIAAWIKPSEFARSADETLHAFGGKVRVEQATYWLVPYLALHLRNTGRTTEADRLVAEGLRQIEARCTPDRPRGDCPLGYLLNFVAVSGDADRAMSVLREYIAAEFQNLRERMRDMTLTSLVGRDDFKRLLAENDALRARYLEEVRAIGFDVPQLPRRPTRLAELPEGTGAFVGKYTLGSSGGLIRVWMEDRVLKLTWEPWTTVFELEPIGGARFMWRDRPTFVEFKTDEITRRASVEFRFAGSRQRAKRIEWDDVRPATLDAAQLAALAGEFQFSICDCAEPFKVNIQARNGRLYYRDTSGDEFSLVPEGALLLAAEGIAMRVEFLRSASGRIDRVKLVYPDDEVVGERVRP